MVAFVLKRPQTLLITLKDQAAKGRESLLRDFSLKTPLNNYTDISLAET
jgi:hypothetical protein